MTSEQKKAIDACKDQAAIDWATLDHPAYRTEVLHLHNVGRFDQIEALRRSEEITPTEYQWVVDRAVQLYGEQCYQNGYDAAQKAWCVGPYYEGDEQN